VKRGRGETRLGWCGGELTSQMSPDKNERKEKEKK